MSRLLPFLIAVSRDCQLTRQLSRVLDEKLSDAEKRDLRAWLKIIEQEPGMAVRQERKKNFRL